MDVDILTKFIDKIDAVTKKPEKYLSLQEEKETEEIKNLTKSVYDYTKRKEKLKKKSQDALNQLIVTNLDEEQIWQQVELQNNLIFDNSVSTLANFLTQKGSLKFPLKKKEKKRKENGIKLEENSILNEEDEFSDDDLSENEVKKKEKKKKIKKVKSSIVDDKFFKLHEMEEFLEKMEKEERSDDEDNEEINYFSDDSSKSNEDSDNQFHYNDFFDQPEDEEESNEKKRKNSDEESETEKKTKRVKFSLGNEDLKESSDDDLDESDEIEENNDEDGNLSDGDESFDGVLEEEDEGDENNEEIEDEEEDEENSNENKNRNSVKEPSTFEARQERLKSRISALEEEALKEKSWQLKGEVTASSRPQNSLLQEYVEFDVATRPAPVITEKSTLKLEDIIIQRIKDKAWDDVVRKIKPVENELEYKKKLVLDQEKSKLSLAQIYEQEYLKQLENKTEDVLDKPEVEPPEHVEIKNMMRELFAKLDALANFHFTPKPVEPEVKIVNNLPAITMEEVAPVATSDAALLAPEEIKAKSKGELIGKSERTATDKKRERRKKKLKQKLKHKTLETKAKAKLEDEKTKNLNSKKLSQKLLQKITKNSNITQLDESGDSKHLKSSKGFFSKLQDEKTSKIKKKGFDINKPKLGKKLNSKKSTTR